MASFDVAHLAAWSGGHWSSQPGCAPTGFCVDARRLQPGQMFVALKTSKRDGHDFLGQAVKAGASAALVSRQAPDTGLAQLVVKDPLFGPAGHCPGAPKVVPGHGGRCHGERGQDLDQGTALDNARRGGGRFASDRGQS